MALVSFQNVLPPYFSEALIAELEAKAILRSLPEDTVLLREGEFVAVAPILLSGLLKVGRQDAEKELLLYYIQPGESCIMSFTSVMQDAPSRVVAVTESESEVLLLPANELRSWYVRFPELQRYFLDLYSQRYEGLIATIDQLAFHRLDARLYHYLAQKAVATGSHTLRLTHQHIAQELGSTREVITRVLKKLESEGKIRVGRNEIEFFSGL